MDGRNLGSQGRCQLEGALRLLEPPHPQVGVGQDVILIVGAEVQLPGPPKFSQSLLPSALPPQDEADGADDVGIAGLQILGLTEEPEGLFRVSPALDEEESGKVPE